jgi:hypothetical protein
LNSLDRKGLDYYSDDFNKLKKSLMAGGASKASSEILHLLNC